MNRSYYTDSIKGFLGADKDTLLGRMTQAHGHVLEDLQKNAWLAQIDILQSTLKSEYEGHIHFEFMIPRMGKRIDNIVIIGDAVILLEFKVGERAYTAAGMAQVIDYALDMRNFHEGSHNAFLIPALVATAAPNTPWCEPIRQASLDKVHTLNATNLPNLFEWAAASRSGVQFDPDEWARARYKPTPTIIEAAQALYRGHAVEDIARNDAGAVNLGQTSACISSIIDSARNNKRKVICFLTGVPGAGKTLAGLNIANERMNAHEDEHAVFLSGNGPLVAVLREALVRDEVEQAKIRGETTTKKQAAIKANAFIQNIHHFRDGNLMNQQAPIEKVVIFDEAQRAWSKEQASSFMKRKKGIADFELSEPEFLIGVMNRHSDWCVIVCLIGGGQEINTGEAGAAEWISALSRSYPEWDVHYARVMTQDKHYLKGSHSESQWIASEAVEPSKWLEKNGKVEDALHLSVSLRSFRSENISTWVASVLDGGCAQSVQIIEQIGNTFPIFVTRDVDAAKNWLRHQAKGSERMGILASSGARRLRPLGIDCKNEIDAPNWFLNPANDIRSSNFLEEIATEFDIQGLEIDWVGLVWDIDYYYDAASQQWCGQSFSGARWQQIRSQQKLHYLKNAYRVLLTRARQGLVICVPEGSNTSVDPTRPQKLYDETYRFLTACGVRELPMAFGVRGAAHL